MATLRLRRESDFLSLVFMALVFLTGIVLTLALCVSRVYAQAEPQQLPTGTADSGHVVTAILALLGTLLSYALTALAQWLRVKKQNALFARATEGLRMSIMTAVQTVNQVYVDALRRGRADGQLTDEEKDEAFDMALSEAKSLLGARGIQILLKSFGLTNDLLDDFLMKHIEAGVREVKQHDIVTSLQRAVAQPSQIASAAKDLTSPGGLIPPLGAPQRAT